MSCGSEFNFCARKGETFVSVLRWGTDVLTSKPITGITQAAPAAITATGHGVPAGWAVAVVSAGGMTKINAKDYPPAGADWHAATVVDANTVSLNDVNSAGYPAYTTGGFLVYSTPVVLTGMTARLVVRDSPLDGAILLTLTEASGIALDNTAKTITITIATAALAWSTGYYDLELTDTAGRITQLLTGSIEIT